MQRKKGLSQPTKPIIMKYLVITIVLSLSLISNAETTHNKTSHGIIETVIIEPAQIENIHIWVPAAKT